MELTKEQVDKILEDAKPSIIEGMKKQVINHVEYSTSPIISTMIKEEVTKFMEKEILPTIRQKLIEDKDGLILSAIKISENIVVALSEGLSKDLKKNLESSYNRREILKALFQ